MKSMTELKSVLGVVALLAVGGAGVMAMPAQAADRPNSIASGNIPNGAGKITAIERVGGGGGGGDKGGIAGTGVGMGAVAGAVVGGVVGNQVGSGSGRTAATVAGAAGGAYVGHQLEKGSTGSKQSSGSGDLFQFTIRMNNGQVHTLRHEGRAGYRVGDHVRIRDGRMSLN